MKRFDGIGVLVRAVVLVTMVWITGSVATAPAAGSAPSNTADRLAALEKSSANQAAAICRGADFGR